MRSVFLVVLLLLGSGLHSIAQKATNLLPVKVNGKWGYINKTGVMEIAPQFDAAGYFDLSFMARVVKDGEVMLISYKNGVVNELETGNVENYEDIKVLSEKLVAYKKDGKWGLTNWKGESLAAPEYDGFKEVLYSNYTFILCQKDNLYGLTDTMGNIVVKTTCSELKPGIKAIGIKQDDKWRLIDYNGKQLITTLADALTQKERNLWSVSFNGKTHLYSISDDKLLELDEGLDFSPIPYNSEYFYITSQDGLGVINNRGKTVVKAQYDNVAINRDCIHVYRNGKVGVYDLNGYKLFDTLFDQVERFDKHVALVRLDDKWGLINDKGTQITKAIYATIDVAGNSAKCRRSETEVDIYELTDGGVVTDVAEYTNVITVSSRYRSSSQRSINSLNTAIRRENIGWFFDPKIRRYGYRDSNYNVVIEPRYTRVIELNHMNMAVVEVEVGEMEVHMGHAVFNTKHKYGVINVKNYKYLYPPNYVYIDVDPMRSLDYKYTRALLSSGKFVMLTRSGSRNNTKYTYIGKEVNGMRRYTIEGEFYRRSDYTRKKMVPFGTMYDIINDMYVNEGVSRRSQWWWVNYRNRLYVPRDSKLKLDDVYEIRKAKWGYLGKEGYAAVRPEFTLAYDYFGESAIAIKGDKYGVLDIEGKAKLSFIYQHIGYLNRSDSMLYEITAYRPNYGMMDSLGNIALDIEYHDLWDVNNGVVRYKDDRNRYGYMSINGSKLGDTVFRNAQEFTDNMVAVRLGRYWSIMDKDGNLMLDTKYTRMGDFSEGLVSVYANYRYGYVDASGNMVIEPKYRRVEPFNNGLAAVSKNAKKYGYISPTGDWVIKPRYKKADNFTVQGYAKVKGKRGYGIVSKEGEVLIKPIYSSIDMADGENIILRKGISSYIYKPSESKIIPVGKVKLEPFVNGYAVYTKANKRGLMDSDGNIVKEATFRNCSNVTEGYYAASGSGTLYIMKVNGDTIYQSDDLKFEGDIENGLLLVHSRIVGYKFINVNGDNPFNKTFQDAYPFKNGIARVKYDDKWGIMNNTGLEIIEPKYSEITEFKEGYAKVGVNYTKGVATNKGDVVFFPDYEKVSFVTDGIFRVEKADKIGYLNIKGIWIWSMQE